MIKNANLENLFKLSSKITVYVPATININEQTDNTKHVDSMASLFSECFGGSTSSAALGYWTSPSAGLVKEKTTIVFAYCTESDLQNNVEKVIDACQTLKDELKQDAIALEINGEMYFI